jgi:DNA gyrase subunit A
VDGHDFERSSAQSRLNVVDGTIRALDFGLPLVAAIDSASDRADAKSRLMSAPFGFDEVQAEHILELPLSRRTHSARANLVTEAAELRSCLAGAD